MLLVGIEGGTFAQPAPSGSLDIDRVRAEVAATRTTAADARSRLSLLYSWFRLLNNQGCDLEVFEPVRLRLKRGETARPDYLAVGTSDLAAVDEGYRVLEVIQADPERHRIAEKSGAPRATTSVAGAGRTDWPLFHGNAAQTGYTDDPGPARGDIAWRVPIGHGWTAKPSIEGDRVYVATPGMYVIAYALDRSTGAVVWKARQNGLNLYGTPRVCSGAVVLSDRIVVREAGSGGETGTARHLVHIDKATGKILRKEASGHVDYRRSHSPVTGDERFLVFPRGLQSIQNKPPLVRMLDTIVCMDTRTDTRLWESRVGEIFAEPVLDGHRVYVSAEPGVLYALNATGAQRVAWHYAAAAPLRATPAVSGDAVYVGANDGTFVALDKTTGRPRWTFRVGNTEPRASVLFSAAVEADGRVYVGAADRRIHCLDARSGALVWSRELGDWVRSRPLVIGRRVFVATLDGRMTALDEAGNTVWTRPLAEHPIFSDLTGDVRGLLVASSDLQLHSLDPANGTTQWRHSLLESAEIDGRRVLADTIAGGADYQSSPTVANGLVFIGGPDHFVRAVEAATGRERWRFETSAQVSAAPIVAEGRVYFGQQGGDKTFYAIDTTTGRPVWQRALGWTWAGAGFSGGNLFVGTVEGGIHCVRARDGQILWTHETNGGVYPNPATDDKNVYTGSWDGHVLAIDQHTGSVRWAFHLGGSPDSAAPVLYDGKVFVQALGRNLHALETETGREVWRYDVPAGWRMNGTPAAHGGRILASIYIDNNGAPCGATMIALDATTGRTLWRHPFGGSLTGAAIARDRAFFASTNHPFVSATDLEGNLLWRRRIGGTVYESCPAISGDRLYVLASDQFLYALE